MAITEGILPGVSKPVALVGIAEKGYADVEFLVETEGGHTSMPLPTTAIGILSTAIHKLEENPMHERMEGPIGKMFEYIGPEMSFAKRMVFANLWCFGGIVKDQLAGSSGTNALIRTTMAATIFSGGIKDNVLPTTARTVVNVRILPGDSTDLIVKRLREIIDRPSVHIRVLNHREPSSVSDTRSQSFEMLHKTIQQVFPDVIVAPSLLIAGTDSRHFAALTQDIYRFVPNMLKKENLSRFHGVDERISVANYEEVVRFYIQLIHNSSF